MGKIGVIVPGSITTYTSQISSDILFLDSVGLDEVANIAEP